MPTQLAYAQVLEPVELQAAEKEGYGRMVLTFKDRTLLPVYDAVVTGGVLRISFEEPVDINVDDVPLALGEYVTIARRDPDGAAIRFAMKRQYRINTLEAGEKLFIDILPLNWQGLPPGLPDDVVRELAKRAEAALRKVRALEQARLKAQEGPSVDLHIGDHPTFTRLVFDWSIKFDTAFVRENDIVKVTFNHPAQLDISRLRAQLPRGVIDATSFLDQGKLKFLMRIEPSVDIRAFREDQTYVIDITPEDSLPDDSANAMIDRELSIEQSDSHSQMVVAPGLRDGRESVQGGAGGVQPAGGVGPPATLEESRADEADAYTVVPIGSMSSLQPEDEDNGLNSVPAPEVAVSPPADGEDASAGNSASTVLQEPIETLPAPETQVSAASEEAVSDGSEITASIAGLNADEQRADSGADDLVLAQNLVPQSSVAGQGSGPVTDPNVLPDQSNGIPNLIAVEPVPEDPARDEAGSGPPGQMVQDAGPSTAGVPSAIELAVPAEGARSIFASDNAPQLPHSPERPPEGVHEGVRNFVAAEARRVGKTVRIVFPFSQPVSSAVFRRNDSIWLVFDTDATIDTRGILSALGKAARSVDVQEYEDHQALRIDLDEPVLATISTDENTWTTTARYGRSLFSLSVMSYR